MADAHYAADVPILLAAYVRLAAAEDSYLEQTHGDAFRGYKETVPGWLPRLN